MRKKAKTTIIPGMILVFLFFFMLESTELGRSSGIGIGEEARWMLVGEPIVNPNHRETNFVVGVTPHYYSERMKGSYDRWSVSASGFSRSHKWVDHDNLELDVRLSASFSVPSILIPDEVVDITVQFSSSGTVNIGNPGLGLYFDSEGILLEGETWYNYNPWSDQFTGKSSITCRLKVPQTSDGEISLTLGLNNCEACLVKWVFKSQEMTPVNKAYVFGMMGDVEISSAGLPWRKAQRGDPIMVGDKIRTGADGLARIYYTPVPNSKPYACTLGHNSEMSFNDIQFPYRWEQRERDWRVHLMRGVLRIWRIVRPLARGWRQSPLSIRSGGVVCAIQGTDVIFNCDPVSGVFDGYVIEGRVEMVEERTGGSSELSGGQKISVREGRFSQVQPLSRTDYDRLAADNRIDDGSFDKIHIAGLNAQVSSLRFYEGPDAGIALDQRIYSEEFSRTDSRYIYWELYLTYPAINTRMEFNVQAQYFKPDGQLFGESKKNFSLEPGWTSSYHCFGLGWPEPGKWAPGTYRVVIFVQGERVIEGSFSIRD